METAKAGQAVGFHDAVRSLAADQCPCCALPKQGSNTFCRKCYYRLPKPMRDDLYRPAGSGYEQVVTDALRTLLNLDIA